MDEAGRALPFAGWTLVVLPGPGSAVCGLLCLPCPGCESQSPRTRRLSSEPGRRNSGTGFEDSTFLMESQEQLQREGAGPPPGAPQEPRGCEVECPRPG